VVPREPGLADAVHLALSLVWLQWGPHLGRWDQSGGETLHATSWRLRLVKPPFTPW